MMIIILILATFVFSGLMIFARANWQRTTGIIVSFIIIAASLSALVLNDNYHWGMQKVTTTQIQDLAPLKGTRAALGVKKLGSGTERVLAYRVKDAQKVSRTKAATTTTIKVLQGRPATVQITTTTWQYRHHSLKVLFSLGNHHSQVASRHYLFTIPKNWRMITIK